MLKSIIGKGFIALSVLSLGLIAQASVNLVVAVCKADQFGVAFYCAALCLAFALGLWSMTKIEQLEGAN